MFERELVRLRNYIDELDSDPINCIDGELQRNSYYKFAANEIMERLLEEESTLPIYIPDRMPYSATEIVENYIGELRSMCQTAQVSEARKVFFMLTSGAESVYNIIRNDGTEEVTFLCQDVFTGRYFESNVPRIKSALSRTNDILYDNGSAALNTYYCNLGISGIKIGYNFSWDYDECNEIKLDFTSGYSEEKKRQCLFIDFETYPRQNTEPWGY